MKSENVTEEYGIQTPRLFLHCCTTRIIEAFFNGEEQLGTLLGVAIPPNWTAHGDVAFRYTYDRITKGNAKIQWLTYLPVLKKTKTLVGCCGFKGSPKNGMVEIGYEVAPDFRGWGLGTEIAQALIDRAFESPEVNLVQAHTLAAINPSTAILEKCGLSKIGEIDDPGDGVLWRWELRRPG